MLPRGQNTRMLVTLLLGKQENFDRRLHLFLQVFESGLLQNIFHTVKSRL